MPLENLTRREKGILHRCLKCVASGEIILHDQEFPTIMGVSVLEFLDVLNAWPHLDERDERVRVGVSNAMNNLIGYPHGKEDLLPYPRKTISRVFAKWRGDTPERG